MKDNMSKISSEKILNSINLKQLSDLEIENAQRRVWNTLSHSINQTNTQIMPDNTVQQKKVTFWNKYNKFIAFGSVATMIVFSAAGGGIYYYVKNNNSTKPQIADHQDQKKDIKKLAAARLQELTGLTVEDYKKVESAKSANLSEATGATRLNTSQNYSHTGNSLDTAAVKEIAAITQNTDQKIYHTKSEITQYNSNFINQMYYGNPEDKSHPKLDNSKPVVNESWSSSISNKNIMTQDNGTVIINLSIYNPEFSIDYRGGKYAVKTNFENNNNYLPAYSSEVNPDLSFVKYIIEDNQNIKETGTKVIDGKTLTIFEEKMLDYSDKQAPESNEFFNYSTKYYVDMDNLSVVVTEYYMNGELATSMKKLVSETLNSDQLDKAKSYDELKGIEVKEMTNNLNFDYSSTYSDFIKNFNIYYFKDIDAELNYVYDGQQYIKNMLNQNELTMNSDFDPLFSESNFMPTFDTNIASYGQNQVYYNISTKNPIDQKKANGYSKIETKNITITLDGKSTNATLVTEEYLPLETGDTNSTGVTREIAPDYGYSGNKTYSLVFESNGYWYSVNESAVDFTKPDSENLKILQSNINLVSLTSSEAQELDRINEAKEKAAPKMNYEIDNLNMVSEKIRLLPGDLSSKYGLNLNSVRTSMISGNESNCDKYYLVSENFSTECLIEKFNGFQITFSPNYSENSSSEDMKIQSTSLVYSSLELIVLDSKLNTVENYLKEYQKQNANIIYKERDGKTIIALNYYSIENSDINAILDGMNLNRDYDLLNAQLKETLNRGSGGVIEPMRY